MSELRKRRGGSEAIEAKSGPAEGPNREELIDELTQMLSQLKRAPKPGTSNEAKKIKDELVKDPYNMQLIYQLGRAYAQDEQWDRCANVLLRGWKRVSELPDKAVRFEFLCALCQASLHGKKFRQALAVLNDVEEPDKDEGAAAGFEVLKCQVYCAAGDLQKGLKAFNAAVEGEDFDTACSVWAGCSAYLKKVGGFEVTKHTLESKASSDADKQKLKAMESLAELRDSVLNQGQVNGKGQTLQLVVLGSILLVLLAAIFYFLHLAEAQNLERLKIRK